MENQNYKIVYYIQKIIYNNGKSEYLEMDLLFINNKQAIEYFERKYPIDNEGMYILYKTFLDTELDDDIVNMQILKKSTYRDI